MPRWPRRPAWNPVSAPVVLPAGVAPEDVTGFDLAPPPAAPSASGAASVTVKDGDTMWDLITAHYGRCDLELLALVASASGIADPQRHLHRPGVDAARARLFAGAAGRSPIPSVAAGEATWALHTIVAGDTLWDILEGHYGFVSADLVWSIAAYNASRIRPTSRSAP